MMHIRPIAHTQQEITAVATLLVEGFSDRSPAWPTIDDGIREVIAYSTQVNISLVATFDNQIVGWISATPRYHQSGWELHPLVVAPHMQLRGIGRALVEQLCHQLAQIGATVLFAWSDDEQGTTSLGSVELFPDPLQHLARFESSMRHAGGFYLKQKFYLCGILPDANGRGKPDILFARRIP